MRSYEARLSLLVSVRLGGNSEERVMGSYNEGEVEDRVV